MTKTKTKTLTKSAIDKAANQIGDLIFGGLNMWLKAGEVLVELIDSDPDAKAKLCKANTSLTKPMLSKFEQIGRKVYDPRLLLRDCAGYTKARKLPYSAQQKLLKNKVKVAVSPDVDDHRLVDLGQMTPQETRVAFSEEGVRSVTEQRAFMKSDSQAKQVKKVAANADYTVNKGKVTFNKGVQLDIAGIAAILKQMTS